MADHDRGRVAADGHERAVAERDLARIPGQDVQPEDRDEVDAHVGDLGGTEVAEPVGEDGQESDAHQERDPLGGERDDPPARHARLTVARPNSPLGLTRSTARITTNAAGSLSASPTKST